jgi:phage terminase large subunit
MVAAVASPHRPRNVKLVTEFRGNAARLFTEARGEIVLSGSAGTGKTRQILEWIHQRCSNERLRVLMVRKTLESLKASALVTFQEQVLHEFDGKRSVMDGVEYFGGNTIRPAQFTYLATGSVVILGGMDRSSKVLSTEYDVIYVNECTELTLDEWERLTNRVDRPSLNQKRPPSVLVGDCNPDAPTHWIMQRHKQGALQLWKTTHRDNPAMWDRRGKDWTDAGRRYLDRLDGLTGIRRQRLLQGLWVAAEGAVYAFDRQTHVVPNPFSERRQAVRAGAGVDWGFTNPGTILVGQMDGDGRICITREVYQTRQTIDWWIARAQALQATYGIDWFACDPSEPAYIEQFKQAGINAVAAQNPILPGIDAVAQRLRIADDGLPRLTFAADMNTEPDDWLQEHKRPVSVVDEFDSYIWDTRAGRKEKPVDDANHALDALRYLCMEFDNPQGGTFEPIDPFTLAVLRDMGV